MKELLKKKSVKIALLLIILLVAAVIIGFNTQSAQRQKEYDNHIEAAQKYLTELDYEQAIAEYILAYEIEPSEEVLDALEQTYIDYAQTYVDTGDYERAISILEEGYAQTGRESLRERMEEVQQQMEAAQRRQQEEKEKDALRELVESEEFQGNIHSIVLASSRGATNGYIQYISDEQIREVCKPMIESLEQYRELYADNIRYYQSLPDLYLISGEYELCKEIRQELFGLFSDFGNGQFSSGWCYSSDRNIINDINYDEYGRILDWKNYVGEERLYDATFEYDENGRRVKEVYQGSTEWIYTVVCEYDAEGRTIKFTESSVDPSNGSTVNSEYTYEYNQTGATQYCTREAHHNPSHEGDRAYSYRQQIARDIEIVDEYGKFTYGEFYDEYYEEY